MLCESLLISDAQITPEGEEASQNACSRLHQAVDTLLELLNQANKQVRSNIRIAQPSAGAVSHQNCSTITVACF